MYKKSGLLALIVIFGCFNVLCGQTVGQVTMHGLRYSYIEDGIKVDFMLEHLDTSSPNLAFKEGENVRFTFSVFDTATIKPLSGVNPAAWMQIDETENADSEDNCKKKIERFLTGGIFGKADIDLNVFHVVALNEDATISVVDPLFGYGGSKLLALVQLPSQGKDWALSLDKKYVFVTCPDAHNIVVIETDSWKISKIISLNNRPDRTVLQPDGHYLWVAYQEGLDGVSSNSGVAVIDAKSLEIKATILTGAGAHDIVINDDSRYAFVSNYIQGTVTVIEVGDLKKLKDIKTSPGPGFMAWSSPAQTLYVTHQADGNITCIEGTKLEISNLIPAGDGITRIRFAPGGRLGFIVNPLQSMLYILDAANNKIIQRGKVEATPVQVVFSDQMAYIRHRGSETVLMVPLAGVGVEGQPIPVADFPAGDRPPGELSHLSLADGIVQAPGGNAMVFANPLDESIYFYKEGMAAPMGAFNNYRHKPLAVMVVDRSLKETSPGCYQTIVKLQRPGKYFLTYYMTALQLGNCFEVEVKGEGDVALARTLATLGPLKITPLFYERSEPVGKEVVLRFALHPHDKAEAITGLKDVELLYLTNSGQWSKRVALTENEKVPGVYEAAIQFPKAGVYFLYVSSLSKGLSFNNPQYILINATESIKD